MNLLPFDIYSRIEGLKSSWSILGGSSITEGISFDSLKGMDIDFEKDEEGDIVKLAPPTPTKLTRKSKVPVFRGYVLENVKEKKEFAEYIKKWGAIEEDNFSALIARTFPEELRNSNIEIIFITGSSDPLSSLIANAIKSMYFPDAKIIDIMKKYYGADINDIVDWEEYEKADPRTKKMIDTYLNQFKRRKLGDMPKSEFEGYIKKSSGLQSGARRILKPGHSIDELIINSIKDTELKWTEEYSKDSSISPAIKARMLPNFLVVDDTIIEGSTLKGIFKNMIDSLDKVRIQGKISNRVLTSIYGYVLFGYKN